MQLEKYIDDVLESNLHPDSLPESLELTPRLVEVFDSLYKRGEDEGREYGCNLTYDPLAEPKIRTGEFYAGDDSSCDIRPMAHFENFGNAHSHPTDSIGDPGGFSAHSIQDFLAFGDQIIKNKPVFVSFVVSGEMIYAVVYRHGYTTFLSEALLGLSAKVEFENTQYFKKWCPVDEETRRTAQGKIFDNALRAQYVYDLKRKTPGWGENLMRTARAACMEVAGTYRFGFYSRVSALKLDLQE